jgi:hypothetical protein
MDVGERTALSARIALAAGMACICHRQPQANHHSADVLIEK